MSGLVEILIVGAGPTGLALALQAHEHGATVRIVDRRPCAVRPSRALIMHPRSLEGLRPLGLADAILEKADAAPAADLHLGQRFVRVRLGGLALADSAFPHLTLVRQAHVEAVLTRALADRGVEVERGTELVAFERDNRATLQTPTGIDRARCDFLVGCDGQTSRVRHLAGIDWRGGRYAEEVILADVELQADLADDIAHVVVRRPGVLLLFALGERATWRLLATRRAGPDRLPFGHPGPPVECSELQELLQDASIDARITAVAWSARYPLQHRLAARFRSGRSFLAGDAAHAFSPATGQGMNTGIQDALNLGWKLAFAGDASDCEGLLDSYEFERRPVARRVLVLTHLAFWAEAGGGPVPALVRGTLAPLLVPVMPFVLNSRRLVAELVRAVSQFRLAYRDSPLSVEGTPRLRRGARPGEWLGDATVTTEGRSVRLHTLLATPGVHVLVHRDAPTIDPFALGPQVALHRLSSTAGPGVVAVRPDGYIGFTSAIADVVQLHTWLRQVGAAQP